MPKPSRKLALAALSGALFVQNLCAHTVSVGYENAGPGAVTFWYGTYHNPVSYTEGSLSVAGPGFSTTSAFTQLTSTKPAGLIDGTTNFYSNGTTLVGTYGGTVFNWQGATATGLSASNYTFAYIPIASPTSTWQPTDTVILSSNVMLSAAVVGGGGSGLRPNATNTSLGAAGALDDLAGSATGDMAAVIAALQALSPEEQRVALQHIAPETSRAVGLASSQTVSGVLDSVAARLASVRTRGYQETVADGLAKGRKLLLAGEGDLSSLSSGDTSLAHGLWVKAFGYHGEQSMKDGFAGYLADTSGLSLGSDILLDNRWVVGGALTYASTDVSMRDFRSGDGSHIDSYQLTGYASRDFGMWYLEAVFAYARQSFTSTRDTGVAGIANADFNGDQWAARIIVGWPFALPGNLTLTPMAGVEWNHLRQDGYTETGAGPLSMMVAGVSADRLRGAVGGELSTKTDWRGYDVRPSVKLLWRHEFENDGIDSTATFTGGGATFVTPGQKLEPDTISIGGQLSISRRKRFDVSVRADAEFASGYSAYAAQVLAEWQF